MPRITLAHWHGSLPPGTETTVTAEELAALTRDGRVAAVHDEPAATPRPAEAAKAPSAEADTPAGAGRKPR
jgi:hypothetical protein